MKLKDLIVEKPNYKNQIELFIEGDESVYRAIENDYVSSTHILSIEEFEELLPSLLKLNKNRDWVDFSQSNEEDYETLLGIVPCGSNDDIHTVTDIKCWFLSKDDSIRYQIILD